MSSRSIDDLHALFRPKAVEFLAAGKAAGLDILVYSTLRTIAEQNELYTHGRTAPGKVVTWAHGGESAHNYGLAFDGVPMLSGKPVWDEEHPIWLKYGRVAIDVGLEWAGNWPGKKREFPHVQFPNWTTIAGVK